MPRQELFDSIVASRWPRKSVRAAAGPAEPAAGKPEKTPAAAEKEAKEEQEEAGDGLGTFEDFIEPAGS